MVSLRKRAAPVDYTEDKENRVEVQPAKRAKKAATNSKATKAAESATETGDSAAKRANANPRKAKSTSSTTKAGNGATKKSPSNEKLYKTTVGAVDKKYKSLEKLIKPNSCHVSSDSFASAMLSYRSDVENLLGTPSDGPRHAFNLLMYLGDNSYGGQDLGYTAKFCGSGGAHSVYSRMDDLMLKVIDARIDAETNGSDAGPADAEEQSFVAEHEEADELAALQCLIAHKSMPNKSARNQLVKLRRAEFHEKVQNARRKREVVKDWKANAVGDIEDTRKYLGGFGIDENYFTKSLDKLEE